ncbi:hypothetical protein SAMN05444673_2721 [Bacillus sp. OV166]|uniref:hypothetical protein n=1 Tax=Bacillus sp. OV166 TaxID=1882763 RepID=UPI000A2ADA7C|nr:hypothetical protein [Bacillus sp. OV166]SMQ77379.1 hypothetical protein SAMN05444673_2721 [Bacillus sp. OV166]
MKIYVTMKSLAMRKAYLTKKEIHLEGFPTTLRVLLTELVSIQIQEFNATTQTETNMVSFLTNEEIEQQVYAGKVGFGTKYSDQKADLQTAVRVAIQAFEDGLYRVVINEKETLDLDERLGLQEEDQLTFIKLTMLAGRMW